MIFDRKVISTVAEMVYEITHNAEFCQALLQHQEQRLAFFELEKFQQRLVNLISWWTDPSSSQDH